MTKLVELSRGNSNSLPEIGEWIAAMVLRSVGPVRHEVDVPFHDSQARKKAILIQTGWDARWGTEAYWEPGPVLSENTIFRMVRSGVRLVGVDFWVSQDRSRQTRLIVGEKLHIVENLRGLAALPRWGLRVAIVPESPPGGPTYAVRAFAEIT